MKKTKLLTAGMLAMLALNVASAQTEIRLTGSTAFRKATVNSIQHVLTAGYVWGSTTGSGISANQQVFVGTVGSTLVSSSSALGPAPQAASNRWLRTYPLASPSSSIRWCRATAPPRPPWAEFL